jgi:hypothetical protein
MSFRFDEEAIEELYQEELFRLLPQLSLLRRKAKRERPCEHCSFRSRSTHGSSVFEMGRCIIVSDALVRQGNRDAIKILERTIAITMAECVWVKISVTGTMRVPSSLNFEYERGFYETDDKGSRVIRGTRIMVVITLVPVDTRVREVI